MNSVSFVGKVVIFLFELVILSCGFLFLFELVILSCVFIGVLLCCWCSKDGVFGFCGCRLFRSWLKFGGKVRVLDLELGFCNWVFCVWVEEEFEVLVWRREMFYSQFILAKKGPLGTIWIAAHLERKLRKNQVADTDIGVSVG